jgi:hypothetical protein
MSIILLGSTSGSITLQEPAVAGTTTISLPATSGTVAIEGTTPAFNGIVFPATQVVSTGANTLDDYEEGTWTPTFICSGASFGYAFQAGSYVKVGKMCTLFAAVSLNSASGISGNGNGVFIGNLPFAQQSGALYWIPGACGNWNALNTSAVWVGGNANAGTTFSLYIATAATTGTRQLQGNDLTSTSFISISLTYPTSV